MRLLAFMFLCTFSLPALAAGEAITIERAATFVKPADMPTAGIFMVIKNSGEADKLIGAKSSLSQNVMIHTTEIDAKGEMTTRAATSLDVPATWHSYRAAHMSC